MLDNNLSRGRRRYKKSGKREKGEGRMEEWIWRKGGQGMGSKEEREIQNYTNHRHMLS